MTEKNNLGKQKRFQIKHRSNSCQPITFSEKHLYEELLRETKAIKMPSGMAETIATKIAEQVGRWAEKRSAVTASDIDRRVALEAKKYSADLAYVYQNRGKIV